MYKAVPSARRFHKTGCFQEPRLVLSKHTRAHDHLFPMNFVSIKIIMVFSVGIEFLFKYTTFVFPNLIKAPPSISAGLLAKDRVSLPTLLVLFPLLRAIHCILCVLGSNFFFVLMPNWSWELCYFFGLFFFNVGCV